MRSLFLALLLGSTLVAGFAFGPARWPASLLAVTVIAAGVVLSWIASSSSGALASLSVVFGAVGALGAVWVAPRAPVLAGVVLVSAVFAARAVRADGWRGQVLHVSLSLIGGLAGTACAASYAHGTLTAQLAAIVVSGVLASVVLLVPVVDSVTFALGLVADDLTGAARVSVARATYLARLSDEIGPSLPSAVTRRLRRSLLAVLSLAEARQNTRAAAADILDRQISAHVSEIERLLNVATEVGAREAGLKDEAFVDIRARGDVLAAQASALAEVSALAHERDAGDVAVTRDTRELTDKRDVRDASEALSPGAGGER